MLAGNSDAGDQCGAQSYAGWSLLIGAGGAPGVVVIMNYLHYHHGLVGSLRRQPLTGI